MIKIRPFLKWAGNKYQCIEQVISALVAGPRLIEPFTGSAAIFMNTDYPDYILAEENQDLISLFQFLKAEGDAFVDYCEQLFCKKNNQCSQYYSLRDQFNRSDDARQRAALFLYLNRHGYNGLCRYNQKGEYNVPFGSYTNPYFPRFEMQFFHLKSQKTTLVQGDFRDTFALAHPGDVIYCDPPYAPLIQTSNFSAYTYKKFTEKEQITLAQLAKDSAQRGITVVISNHDTPFTRFHYQPADILSFNVRRYISCRAGERKLVPELVAVFKAL